MSMLGIKWKLHGTGRSIKPGHVVAPDVMYYGTRDWLKRLESLGRIALTLFDPTDRNGIASAIRAGKTDLVWIETPLNPTWDVIDIEIAAKTAHEADAILAGAARTHDERVFLYRLGKFLSIAQADFGKDERVERDGESAALAMKSLRDIFRERLHPKTGKPIDGEYVVPEYQEAREAFRKELTKLRKKARKPIALGMPAAGSGILPILEIIAALVGIEKPWWFKDDHED